eukprot:COSAG01_NODE_695_length_14201_cov_10.521875_9_plen_182_part_00
MYSQHATIPTTAHSMPILSVLAPLGLRPRLSGDRAAGITPALCALGSDPGKPAAACGARRTEEYYGVASITTGRYTIYTCSIISGSVRWRTCMSTAQSGPISELTAAARSLSSVMAKRPQDPANESGCPTQLRLPVIQACCCLGCHGRDRRAVIERTAVRLVVALLLHKLTNSTDSSRILG